MNRYLLILLILSILASSCSPLVKMHHEINPMNIAVLYNEKPSASEVEFIDDENVQSFLSKQIYEVLPGKHVVQVYRKDLDQPEGGGSTHKTRPVLVEFTALPRHIYALRYHLGTYYSGADISDVTEESIKALTAKKDKGKWEWAEEYIDKWKLK
jgi:hypothetical protein